ncbi:hypothetical protein PAJ34TS1_15840 [Paenibacillus azoreducens]|uniref:Uncharacterized protein n=1 Tax=Paenibacillus azoreducens TaxID=116718 RepID=A0A920CR20_9BACL|nr:hypothetical protein J34TS1_14090 [Paenibacillus azoreducens]
MKACTVQAIYYNQAPDALRREIAVLLNRIWPDDSLMSSGTITCKPHLAGFYDRAGAWPVVPDVTLIGSRDTGGTPSPSV